MQKTWLLIKIICVILVRRMETGRSFSFIRWIHSWLRNSMSKDVLGDLTANAIHVPTIFNLKKRICNAYIPMDTFSSNRRRFDVKISRGKLFGITSILKCVSTWNYDIDATWKIQRGFDFKNRRNIYEFSSWVFRRCFDVDST